MDLDPSVTDSDQKLKERIEETVRELQGCKLSTLVTRLLNDEGRRAVYDEYADKVCGRIDELVLEKKLVRISYVLKKMSYREKCFLLPADTQITIEPRA